MKTTLRNAVIKQLGYTPNDEELPGTMNAIVHTVTGISGGFGQFIYYTDTIAFFKKNRADIVELCKEMAEEFDQDIIAFVASFNCLTDDRETRDEIGRAIYGRLSPDDTQVPNALAWFAAEECAREFVDAQEQEAE